MSNAPIEIKGIKLTIIFTFFFFFNDTATTEIYTLSLHDALPICLDDASAAEVRSLGDDHVAGRVELDAVRHAARRPEDGRLLDRKSTRLNSSHGYISYAVFCLKKKQTQNHVCYSMSL